MGRHSYSYRQKADPLLKISVYWLKNNGYFLKDSLISKGIKWTSGWIEKESSINLDSCLFENQKYIRLRYTQTDSEGNSQKFDYKVSLTTTPCHFGGIRYWFVCPLSVNGRYCGRRVGVLYKGNGYFGCRHCFSLTYEARNQSGYFKTTGKVISIPELEKLRSEIKREYYAGKPTRRYLSYLRKEIKSQRQLLLMANLFNNKKRKS